MHVCWGNYEGPHHHDVPMERLLPIVLKAKPHQRLREPDITRRIEALSTKAAA